MILVLPIFFTFNTPLVTIATSSLDEVQLTSWDNVEGEISASKILSSLPKDKLSYFIKIVNFSSIFSVELSELEVFGVDVFDVELVSPLQAASPLAKLNNATDIKIFFILFSPLW